MAGAPTGVQDCVTTLPGRVLYTVDPGAVSVTVAGAPTGVQDCVTTPPVTVEMTVEYAVMVVDPPPTVLMDVIVVPGTGVQDSVSTLVTVDAPPVMVVKTVLGTSVQLSVTVLPGPADVIVVVPTEHVPGTVEITVDPGIVE